MPALGAHGEALHAAREGVVVVGLDDEVDFHLGTFSKSLGGHDVLAGMDLSIRRGETLATAAVAVAVMKARAALRKRAIRAPGP